MSSNAPVQGPDGDWTYAVADRIEAVVGSIRDKTTVPATLAARSVVYGVVAGVLAAIALILTVVAVVRLLIVYLPIHPLSRRVWVAEAIGAAIFLGVGAFLWRRRRPRGVHLA